MINSDNRIFCYLEYPTLVVFSELVAYRYIKGYLKCLKLPSLHASYQMCFQNDFIRFRDQIKLVQLD